MKVADFIIDSRVGALDRALGFIYGAARGILVCAVALLFFNWLAGANTPTWIENAKSRPLLESVGAWIEKMLPEDPESLLPKQLTPETPSEAPAEGTPEPPADGEAPADAETPPANN